MALRISLRQLEYFIAAGEARSITLASERINISPPSISMAVSHLEKEFGLELFVRHHAQGLKRPGFSGGCLVESCDHIEDLKGGIVIGFGFGGRDVADGAEEPAVVEPIDPAQGRHFHGRSGWP